MAKIDPSIFKTYDIRGRYPAELNEEAAAEIAGGLAGRFFGDGAIIVAHDARVSSPALYDVIVKALRAVRSGVEVLEIGLATTPMFYFLVAELKAAGGIMITASHNPKEYNGLKIVGPGAQILSGKEIWKIIS